MPHARIISEKIIINKEENEDDDDANNNDEYTRTKDNDNNDNDNEDNNNDDNNVNTDKERLDKEGSNNTQQYSKRTREQVMNARYISKPQMSRRSKNLTESISGIKMNKKERKNSVKKNTRKGTKIILGF